MEMLVIRYPVAAIRAYVSMCMELTTMWVMTGTGTNTLGMHIMMRFRAGSTRVRAMLISLDME